MKVGDKVRSKRTSFPNFGRIIEIHPITKDLIYYRVKWDNSPGSLLYKKDEIIKLHIKKLKLRLP